jgi:hypothetical protein
MGADRAAAGLGGAAVMVAVAFAPKGVSVVEGVFLGLAVLVLAVAFAPILPGLNRLPGKRDLSTWDWLGRVVRQWQVMEKIIEERGAGPWFYAINEVGIRELTVN